VAVGANYCIVTDLLISDCGCSYRKCQYRT